MKKHLKSGAAYFAANLLLPLSDIGRVLKSIRYVVRKDAERLHLLRQTRKQDDAQLLSFGDAVAVSGCSRAVLTGRYLLIKRVWLSMLFVVSAAALLLLAALLLSGLPVTGFFLARVLSMIFMLTALGALVFVQAMKNQFRLWQLMEQRLGTFAEWRASGAWLRDVFSWSMPR